MPAVVTCPNPACGAPCSVADAAAAQTVRCPRCGKPFTVPAPAARPAAASSTATVGRYQTRARLGAGAFGTVFRAYDPQLDREVALKLLKPEALSSPRAVERFQREARAAARMLHPNIVPVFDAGKHGDSHFIASAFINGKTLADLIPEGGMEPRRAAGLVVQLADALAFAHRQNVLHRDVKPANIMVDPSDHLYLMDFGLAGSVQQERSRMTRLGSVMGTPSYMAPEQAAGDVNRVGPAADIYSTGVVLYELLTGHTPFEGPPNIVLFNVLERQPDPPSARRPGLDPRLEAVCLKAMAKKPADRYAGADELAAELRAWLAGPVTGGAATVRSEPAGGGRPEPSAEKPRPGAATARQARPRAAAKQSSSTTGDDGGPTVWNELAGAEEPLPRARKGRRRSRRWLGVAAAAVVLAGACAAYVALRPDPADPQRVAAVDDRKKPPAPPSEPAQAKPDRSTPQTKKEIAPPETSPPEPKKEPDKEKEKTPPESKTGNGDKKDPPEPVKVLSEAERLWLEDARKGDREAQYHLGYAYYAGERGLVQNYPEGVRWFKAAAEQGHDDAQRFLSFCLVTGKGVVADLKEGIRWGREAARQGNAPAMRDLGFIYEFGRGEVPVDLPEAFRLFKGSAEKNDLEGMFRLANCYADGKGVKKDPAEALKWWTKAADAGHEEAKKTLAAVKAAGDRVLPEVERLSRKKAEEGDRDAQNHLGWAYLFGKEGVAVNEVEAVKWLRKAAEQGHPEAQGNLGWCYLGGKGVARNEGEAIPWLKKSAEQGNVVGHQQLGWCYLDGRGVKQDYREAVRLLGLGAEQGDSSCQFLLGNCYADGKGVARDAKRAVELWKKAADQGHLDAKKALAAGGRKP